MFDILDKIVSDFFNDGVFKNTKRKVKKQRSKNKTEKVKLIPKRVYRKDYRNLIENSTIRKKLYTSF